MNKTLIEKIHTAVWNGEIDQTSTREVATMFECSIQVARRVLLDIVNPSGEEKAVLLQNGKHWTYSPIDEGLKTISTNKTPKHYIWFCY